MPNGCHSFECFLSFCITKRISFLQYFVPFSPNSANSDWSQSRFYCQKTSKFSNGLDECSFDNPDEKVLLQIKLVFSQNQIEFLSPRFSKRKFFRQNVSVDEQNAVSTTFPKCFRYKVRKIFTQFLTKNIIFSEEKKLNQYVPSDK